MPFYLIQVGYTSAAVKTLVDNPQNREDTIKKAIRSHGGKLHSFYFSFGEYDVVVIAEFPDNTTAAAFSLAASSRGAVSKHRTTPLITAEEAHQAMKAAKKSSYTPPK
jgi:uncharacterized protein with GYD domain